MTTVTTILFEITFRQTSLSFKQIFLWKQENINAKWRSRHNMQVTALLSLSHKNFAVPFLLPSCCVNSLLASQRSPGKITFSTPNRILNPVKTDATLLDATCCVVLHTLLRVVGSCCAKVKLLATCKRTRFPIMLRPFARGFTFSVKGSV